MSLYTFFGCLFLAYGPLLSIFFLYIAPNAQYVLLTVASAFFCLIALLLSSIIWYLAKGAQTIHFVSITYSIAIQELCRWGFYLLLRRAESGLNTISSNPKSPFNRTTFAFVSGFGYALMTSLISYISLLVESIGPGVIMCPSCPEITIYFMSAITTTFFSLMHICWMIISFEGFSELPQIKGWLKIIWVISSHYGASFTTVLNASRNIKYGCIYSIMTSLFILLTSTYLVISSLKSKFKTLSNTRRSQH
ncbi:gamma-secretase subunit Aph-1 [Cokeromyces recurvatus]|uniref:gamma-secretase subunit Aph-1 n=1 Tax=Cokeromyces recurvatus TaxID=90255 RepID=UPI00221FF500|nr:gamma-secretase subunit Aph-1 [Cokeromyces recurvatus]KAI7901314.1 gamma-secretase subunit Aph-1 [Cokeromyces recurvatus]